ncbi:MAG: carbohydrate kinase [Actinomycetota bacterium]|nr:carbohydrate kinase [Actinomycetota bacterium]
MDDRAAERRVLVVGEALIDVRHQGNEHSQQPSEHPGGSPLNIAVGLARLGVPTTLAAQVGDDPRGQAIIAHLAASGVELVRLPPHRATATATAHLRPDGSAAYEFDIGWDPVRLPDPGGYRLVHVGSIGASLQPGATAVLELVRSAASAAVPVSIDPNVRPVITPDVDSARDLLDEMIALASVVKLSDEDAAVLWPAEPLDSVQTALAAGPRAPLVVLTRGGAGAVLTVGPQRASAAAPPVDLVDTIGAGDSFMSALLAGLVTRDLLDGRPWHDGELERLGRLAASAAAITCARAGADPPWRSEVSVLVNTDHE